MVRRSFGVSPPPTPAPVWVSSPPVEDPASAVIDALCLGLQFAKSNGDEEACLCFNTALQKFTAMSYERGRVTRENELMRADIDRMRNEINRSNNERSAR